MAGQIQISDLRDVPEHCDALADRVWNAWWRSKGTPLRDVREWVNENLPSKGIPFAVVAHTEGQFVGTASVIKNDLKERPDLSPWVAAVWVDREHRHTGVGTAVVEAAMKGAVAVTNGPVYLCAKRSLAPFYESMGWRRIEEEVDGMDVYRYAEDRNGTN